MISNAKVLGSGIDYATYSRQSESVKHGNPAFIMSRSEIVAFDSCPAKWLQTSDADDSTDSTIFGNLIDCLLLTPDKFPDRYAVSPETYSETMMRCPVCESVTDSKTCRSCKTDRVPVVVEKPWNNGATKCAEWIAGQKGKSIIKSDLKAKADQAMKAITESPIAQIVGASVRQVMVVGTWTDRATDLKIPLRCLIDFVPSICSTYEKALGDFKTARNGNPDAFARVIDDSAYDVQAALSLDLYVAATGEDRVEWIFGLQENVPPFHVTIPLPALTSEFLKYGRMKYRMALAHYAQCLETNEWPSYSTGDRIVINGMQLISPDSLYTYRQTAGLGKLER